MNKKFIKTIASITCGLGIVGTIPAISSCSCSPKNNDDGGDDTHDDIILPENVFEIENGTTLLGFKKDFDISKYPKATTLQIPNQIVTIVKDAFKNYSSIQQITTLDFSKAIGLEQINESAFEGWSEVNFINFDNCDNLELIGDSAFRGCANLSNIFFDSTNTNFSLIDLGEGKAFIEKTNDNKWHDDSSVVGCLGYGNITIPNGITSIANSAFKDCLAITGVYFPSSLATGTISDNAFNGCTNLNRIIWFDLDDAPTTTISDTAFTNISTNGKIGSYHSDDLTAQSSFDCVALFSYFKNNFNWFSQGGWTYEEVSKATVLPNYVYDIDESNNLLGFKEEYNVPVDFPNATKMEIPSVFYINENAFEGIKMNGDEGFTVDLPQSISYIMKNAFANSNIHELIFSNTNPYLSEILEKSFYNCQNLSTITNLEYCTGLIVIGDQAFGNDTSLTSVDLSNCKELIYLSGFDDCNEIASFTMPNYDYGDENNRLKFIGNYAFQNCTFFQQEDEDFNLNVYVNLEKIEPFAFYSTNISNLDLYPLKSLSFIGEFSFASSSLTYVSIPSQVETIGQSAFEFCTEISSIDFSSSSSLVTIGDCAFFYCLSLNNVSLPSNLEFIGDQCFECCTKLESITFDSKIIEIGDYAFTYTDFSNINQSSFENIRSVGEVSSISSNYTSQSLLEYLQAVYYFTFDNWDYI